jgi:hypothetical protein
VLHDLGQAAVEAVLEGVGHGDELHRALGLERLDRGPRAAPAAADQRDAQLLVSGGTTGELVLLLGGPFFFGSTPGQPLGAVSFAFGNPTPFPGAAVLDVDGDGDRDLAVAAGAQAPWLLLNAGAGGFAFAPKAVPVGYRKPFAPPRDVDGDGDADLIRATLGGGLVTLETHRNDGRGRFTGSPVPAGSYPALTIGPAAWADFDGDGDQDLWVGTLLAGQPCFVLLNDGSGTFSLGASINGVGRAASVGFGDFNGDSRVDVIVGRPPTSGFPVMAQQPLRIIAIPVPAGVAFAPPVAFGVADFVTDIAVLDLGPDGDLDLVVGTRSVGTGLPAATYAYENTFSGSFVAQPPFGTALAATVAAGDLDGNSTVDLVLGNETWLALGGTFVPGASHAVPVGEIALADLDGDGDLDLLDSAGAWYEGDGAGAFAAPTVFVPYVLSAMSSGGGAEPIDLDGDGDLDVVGPHAGTPGHFTIYSNLTRQVAATSLASPSQSLGLAVFGPPSDVWFLAASFPAAGAVVLPFGTLFLDPATLVVTHAGVIPVPGRSDVSVALPPNAGGFTLTWQALVGPSLTNAFDTPIVP